MLIISRLCFEMGSNCPYLPSLSNYNSLSAIVISLFNNFIILETNKQILFGFSISIKECFVVHDILYTCNIHLYNLGCLPVWIIYNCKWRERSIKAARVMALLALQKSLNNFFFL